MLNYDDFPAESVESVFPLNLKPANTSNGSIRSLTTTYTRAPTPHGHTYRDRYSAHTTKRKRR